MDNTIVASLIGVAGGLLGVLVGTRLSKNVALDTAELTYKQAVDIMRREDFNKAAAVFKNTFLPEIVYLKHNAVLGEISGRTDSIADLLKSGYIRRHLGAFETFRAILPPEDRRDIQRAWDEYCHPDDIPECEDTKRDHVFNAYSHIKDVSGEEAAKKVALEKLNNIMKFAVFK
jgi:hypothetical protein